MAKVETFTVKPGKSLHRISSLLFGLFLEDINWSCDGGLSANLVNNHSFDGVYFDKRYNAILGMITKKPPKSVSIPLRFWEISGGELESRDEDGCGSAYARLKTNGQCFLANKGFNGGDKHSGECAMPFTLGATYEFSAYLRSLDFIGKIIIHAENADGELLTEKVEIQFGRVWNRETAELKCLEAIQNSYGKLVIEFNGNGTIDIDCVCFQNADYWGFGEKKWEKAGKLRKDLVEVLAEIHPRFMRFPGGCLVEGAFRGNEYRWKDSVCDIVKRKTVTNLWSNVLKEYGYDQSRQVGFYEFFLLCEDLKMEPLPVVWAGLNCQFRSRFHLQTGSPAFYEEVVQNALDLIEFANGDAEQNEWARIRSDMGHPEPFDLKMIAIGNENFGADYLKKFLIVKQELKKKFPDIVCILAAGPNSEGDDFDEAWNFSNKSCPDVRMDEHYYKHPNWFLEHAGRYDNYDRNSAHVFLGEYAANQPGGSLKANCWQTALAEAAFLTGIERNSDIVDMCCYAPLFMLVDGMQWRHNLIGFNPGTALKTVNYFVQQMYGESVGEEYLELEGALPDGVYASATKKAGTTILKLVNTGKQALQCEIPCEGTAQVKYLQCSDLKAANALTFTGEPEYIIVPKTKLLPAKNGRAVFTLEQYGFYVITIGKGIHQ